ncbi:hypothetical protein SDC9_85480 [bioreactor metagenome]|uniref:HTH cro/C1-type domain-containing protein n=1 Tax=bioreactor metagenome TaxID=1076179 RepID=A0A644ZDA4_9ZZZZ
MVTFGERLKYLRQEKNLTLYKAANLLGTTSSTLCHYENDLRSPNCEFLKICADFFHVSSDYLLGRVPIRQVSDSTNYIRLSVKEEALNKDSKRFINSLSLFLSKYDKYLEYKDYELLKVFTETEIKIIGLKNKEKSLIMQNNGESITKENIV